MHKLKNPLRKFLDRVQSRFARSRPGSVLVLVVALLVLMALIGTAYITTARTDRFSAQQNSFNTEIDLLVQGVVNMAQAKIATISHEQAGGQHWDDTRTDTWLSSRIPGSVIDACGAYTAGHVYARGDYVMDTWPTGSAYVSLQDNNGNAPAAGPFWYKLPATSAQLAATPAWSALSSPLAPDGSIEDPSTGKAYASQSAGQPAIVALPSSVVVGGKVFPAVQFYDFNSGGFTSNVLAASASGDGIADSLLWRLPIGEINGVTYYAAVRIIDNNSAVNLNTALSSTYDFEFGSQNQSPALGSLSKYHLSPGIFPANIGLAEMLKTYNPGANSYQTLGLEMVALSKYRSGIAQGGQLVLPDGMTRSNTYQTDEYQWDAANPQKNVQRKDFEFNTLAEALFMGMGRRLNNPGYFVGTSRYQTLSWGDAASLDYSFDLVNPNSSPCNSEGLLFQSLYNGYRSTPWNPATDIFNWFATFQAQAYGSPTATVPPPFYCARPFVTPHNPLNNLMPAHPADSTKLPQNYQNLMTGPYGTTTNSAPKVSLNTAPVWASDSPIVGPNPSLWLGFYNAMYDGMQLSSNPPPTPGQNNPPLYQQFRSSLRDPTGSGLASTTYLNPAQMVWLRSLIAAINTEDLRDSDDDISSRQLQTTATVVGKTNSQVTLTVFGNERQPFITEVFANNDTGDQPEKLASGVVNPNKGKKNLKGYVAIELHNPYPFPISLNGYQLGILSRSTTAAIGKYPGMVMTPIDGFLGFGPVFIPADGYAILDNMPDAGGNPPAPGGNDAQFQPFINYDGYAAPGPRSKHIYVANLHEVFPDGDKPGGELFLLRPRLASGALSPSEMDKNGLPVLQAMVPVDAFDFSGTLSIPATGITTYRDMHYVRANGIIGAGATPQTNNRWRFVYPGRWFADRPQHQEGIVMSDEWSPQATPPAPNEDPWISTPPGKGNPTPANNGSGGAAAAPINLGNPDPAPSYPNRFPAIQLNNTDFAGPNKMNTSVNTFPYGGFARVGDVLQVPFIGGYTVTDPTNNNAIIEMNPVTRDCALADDIDDSNDEVEQVGRFCPLASADPTHQKSPNVPTVGDSYRWAANVLDYFTAIQNPHDDYLPNVDPYAVHDPNAANYWMWDPASSSYKPGNAAKPVPVPNLARLNAGTANRGNEDIAPIEGLININTAPFAVLRRVPFILNQPGANDQIAQAIVTYRNNNGPFKTLFDLNSVPGFQSLYGDPSTLLSSYDTGDLSTVGPNSTMTDGIVNDFERRFMAMTRASNLLTTRSDTYTAYILVQGWRGIGTNSAEMVVQRRAAFIADRSGMTQSNKSLNVINVQTN